MSFDLLHAFSKASQELAELVLQFRPAHGIQAAIEIILCGCNRPGKALGWGFVHFCGHSVCNSSLMSGMSARAVFCALLAAQ